MQPRCKNRRVLEKIEIHLYDVINGSLWVDGYGLKLA